MSFNVVRHTSFIAVVDATSKVGFDYKLLTYNAMKNKHIEPMRKRMKVQIEEKLSIASPYMEQLFSQMDGTTLFIGY